MAFADRTQVDVGHPAALALFQADYRIPLVFFRSGMGEWVLPPGMHFELALFVVFAALVRLFLQWLYVLTLGPFVDYWAFVRGETVDVILWGVLALVVFLAARPHCRENAARARSETEIIPTSSIGWPRKLDVNEFYAQPMDVRREIWRKWALVYEPTMGLVASLLLGVIDPWIGTYVATNVVVLAYHQAEQFHRQRMERLGMSDAIWSAYARQQLLEDLQKGDSHR